MERIAVYTGTRNIYKDMIMSAKSLIANSAVDEVHFFIEDDDMGVDLPDMIICHNVSDQTYYKPGTPNMESGFTYMAMLRIAMCHLLPYNTALLLDSDLVVEQDCTDIWDIDLTDYYFSSTPEHHRTMHGLLYCNFGVVYYNLKKLRNGKADECIEVLNHQKFNFVEQDVCNCLCQGYIHKMPARFNSTRFTDKTGMRPVIRHYAGVPRPKWINKPEVKKWRNMDWDEVMKLHDQTVARYKKRS